MKKFYVTTPIYYPSANAHLGHCYSTIAADTLARFKRMQGFDVIFSTGSDEHGQKIENCARKAGVTPKKFVDDIVSNFKKLWDILNISYDKFIRTTDDYHVKSVSRIFTKLYNEGKIYKGKYTGWYCVPCESFFTETQLIDGKCPDCGRDVVKQDEEAYFFKLSEYQDRILDILRNKKDFILPESRKNEMINFVEQGLQDLCVSRSSFNWGIPVEFDKSHVVYVWLDALTNYINLLRYPDGDDFKKFWPADVHIMGKEIVRFHSVIWPAILMALDLPLPKKIFGHGWILYGDGDKMSKSKGNVVDPFILCDKYGADALRYFLLREIPFGSDGLFSVELFIKRINSDLANDLGNLLSRSTALVDKYFNSSLIYQKSYSSEDDKILEIASELALKCEKNLDDLKFSHYLTDIWALVSECNKYIDLCAPWNLAKDDSKRDRLSTVLYNILESLRVVSILINPVMPDTSKKIQNQLGISDDSICSWESSKSWGLLPKNIKINRSKALFPRLDYEVEVEDLNKMNEEKENLKNMISIDDFSKVKLVVGEIIECEPVKKSRKLLKLVVNDGEKNRTVVSGISQYYSPESLIGHHIILVSNLAPASLCGVESNGMILAASNKDDVKVIFVDDMPAGSVVG